MRISDTLLDAAAFLRAKPLKGLALPSGEPNRRKIKVLTAGLPLQAFPCFLMFFLSCQNVSNKFIYDPVAS
jgi:hypothetical protein